MQSFKWHKIVQAAKIIRVSEETPNIQAHLLLAGEKEGVIVTSEWLARHKPEAGGYYVLYPDGYTSYLPAKAFEEGYTQVVSMTDEQLNTLTGEPILQYFAFAHLPVQLQEVSRPFCALAAGIMSLPRNAERSVALRKLLEAKDAAVRAALAKDITMGPEQVGRTSTRESNFKP